MMNGCTDNEALWLKQAGLIQYTRLYGEL